MSRRVALAAFGALAASGAVGLGVARRTTSGATGTAVRLTQGPGGGMMGIDPADRRTYLAMFSRHEEIDRVVELIPGGVRTTTESSAPDLVAQLQAHVSNMYARMDQGDEVMCMSSSLPTLFRGADGYQRRLTFTANGVIAEETAGDPALVAAIRDHAVEVTGFVRDGMPAMMQQMMDPGGMMGPGGMMPHHGR